MPPANVNDLDQLPAMLTMYQVRDILGVSTPYTYELARMPGFPALRLGRRIRVPKAAFLQWIDTHQGTQPQGVAHDESPSAADAASCLPEAVGR